MSNILVSGADEVVVLDDGSTDKSLELLSEFKIQSSKLKVLEHKKNKGFIPSVNELFEQASGDIVVLLNSDVWVEKNFLEPIIPYFKKTRIFAVNLHEEGEGPSISFWKNGFYGFKRGEEKNRVQKSAWASGGSAAYSKKIWNELGGFDKNFAPFYWEDIDISFRALKAGYEIFWEPYSKVKHQHETTIKGNFSKNYVSRVQQRNQLLFIWKNIGDPNLKREHRINLIKKLLGGMGIGYWIPFIWALSKAPQLRINQAAKYGISDSEAINYAS